MTRKDCLRIANALSYTRPEANWNANKKVQWELDLNAVACTLENYVPSFHAKRDMFFEVARGTLTPET